MLAVAGLTRPDVHPSCNGKIEYVIVFLHTIKQATDNADTSAYWLPVPHHYGDGNRKRNEDSGRGSGDWPPRTSPGGQLCFCPPPGLCRKLIPYSGPV